jgi:hypothetical protein
VRQRRQASRSRSQQAVQLKEDIRRALDSPESGNVDLGAAPAVGGKDYVVGGYAVRDDDKSVVGAGEAGDEAGDGARCRVAAVHLMTEVQQGQVEAVLAQWTQRRRIGRATWVYMRKGLPSTWCGAAGG